ncbi:glycosyltransferase family 4 protein [Streptomyces sp. UNOC14_S4]|uniref:glycosyltransferase family 4 protein n=1 Tax=Streptomyces sp. UNOC14_S4 TaxID=2872340 RepID=UPI001E39F8F8|nr:glycosyltransferase family 4 protein [Streptomyces sp. UNOC14_S4]MCC3766082.1 glycosyltransferase family 4 protein [Streptomyces sp. UNOC14_S4]
MPGIVFVSIDDFTREGFTNGLFLQVRELLQRVVARGLPASLACIAQRRNPGTERRTRIVQGCTVNEAFIRAPGEASAYRQALRDLLRDLDPDVILLNSCAVRLNDAHHAVLDESLASGRHVAVLVTDQLFPTSSDHPADEARCYYNLMQQASVHAVSQTIADAFHSQVGVPARVLPNLLPERRVSPAPAGTEGRCLTLINHHPIKGRRVWDALIRQRPSDAYLVKETWRDVPLYVPPSPNVQVIPFTPAPTTIYNCTRILLVPSLGPEGLARVTLEAMESGVPVIAHRIGSLPELGNAAMFVTPPPIVRYELEGNVLYPVVSPNDVERAARDFGQAIDAIDHDPTLRARFVASGRALVRDYRSHSEAIVDQLLDTWFGTM